MVKETEGRKPPPLRERIFELLLKEKDPITATEVAERLQAPYSTTVERLKVLTSDGFAKRIPAAGRGFKYVVNRYVVSGPATDNLTLEMDLVNLKKFLDRWQQKWNPKIFESARNLPRGLARLCELAVEASYGTVIPQQDVTDIKLQINDFRSDLEQTLRVVNGILALEQIWKNNSFAPYLLQMTSVHDLQRLAFKVKENN